MDHSLSTLSVRSIKGLEKYLSSSKNKSMTYEYGVPAVHLSGKIFWIFGRKHQINIFCILYSETQRTGKCGGCHTPQYACPFVAIFSNRLIFVILNQYVFNVTLNLFNSKRSRVYSIQYAYVFIQFNTFIYSFNSMKNLG